MDEYDVSRDVAALIKLSRRLQNDGTCDEDIARQLAEDVRAIITNCDLVPVIMTLARMALKGVGRRG